MGNLNGCAGHSMNNGVGQCMGREEENTLNHNEESEIKQVETILKRKRT